jgi:hypothetical protein
MTEASPPAGHQPLRPRARLMLMLGVELISSEAVAVSELVKNSYDADASTVLVSLSDATSERPAMLTVMDDGLGMSAQIVVRTWPEPATPSRRRRKISPAPFLVETSAEVRVEDVRLPRGVVTRPKGLAAHNGETTQVGASDVHTTCQMYDRVSSLRLAP